MCVCVCSEPWWVYVWTCAAVCLCLCTSVGLCSSECFCHFLPRLAEEARVTCEDLLRLNSSPGNVKASWGLLRWLSGIKNLPAMQETQDTGLIPGWGRPPEEDMAAPSSILAWRIPMDRGAWRAAVRGVAVVGRD